VNSLPKTVKVWEIVDSEFPGYVYLMSSCELTECVDNDKYNAVQCERELMAVADPALQEQMHGPAVVHKRSTLSFALAPATELGARLVDSPSSSDNVFCVRCLTWPPQAADWPTRYRRVSDQTASLTDVTGYNTRLRSARTCSH